MRIELDPTAIPSRGIDLAQIQQAFEAFRDRDAGALKVNVDFPTADRA